MDLIRYGRIALCALTLAAGMVGLSCALTPQTFRRVEVLHQSADCAPIGQRKPPTHSTFQTRDDGPNHTAGDYFALGRVGDRVFFWNSSGECVAGRLRNIKFRK